MEGVDVFAAFKHINDVQREYDRLKGLVASRAADEAIEAAGAVLRQKLNGMAVCLKMEQPAATACAEGMFRQLMNCDLRAMKAVDLCARLEATFRNFDKEADPVPQTPGWRALWVLCGGIHVWLLLKAGLCLLDRGSQLFLLTDCLALAVVVSFLSSVEADAASYIGATVTYIAHTVARVTSIISGDLVSRQAGIEKLARRLRDLPSDTGVAQLDALIAALHERRLHLWHQIVERQHRMARLLGIQRYHPLLQRELQPASRKL